MDEFPDEDACFNAFVSMRTYPCTCGKEHKYRIKGTRLLSCACGHQISPFTGTILEKSRTPLKTWFYAIYLFSQSTHGVSAAELQRQLGVTQKTAWRMGHQIRKLMAEDNQVNTISNRDKEKLKGIVEADEAYFGGNSKNDIRKKNTGRGTSKAAIFGMVERGGRVKARKVDDVTSNTLMEMIAFNIKAGSKLMTDEFSGYRWAIRHGLFHHRVQHGKRHYGYRKGSLKVNTNTVESFWALFKGGVRGTHRFISRKYLQYYLDERVFHYNHRHERKRLFRILLERLPS